MATPYIEIGIPAEGVTLSAALRIPASARGLVLLGYSCGSGGVCGRDLRLTRCLEEARFGTLLVDLLTEHEEAIDSRITFLKLDIGFLAARLIAATTWASSDPTTGGLPLGYFGTSTAAAAALEAAARVGDRIGAVVSRGGRPDLADRYLPLVRSPTLLIVGDRDVSMVELNRRAYARLRVARKFAIVPGTGQMFEEWEALDTGTRLAVDWFSRHLPGSVKMSRFRHWKSRYRKNRPFATR